MSHETERPRLIIPALVWLVSFVAAIVIVLQLSGCASSSELTAQVCYLKVMGKTEEGHTVVMQACMSPEAFAETQK